LSHQGQGSTHSGNSVDKNSDEKATVASGLFTESRTKKAGSFRKRPSSTQQGQAKLQPPPLTLTSAPPCFPAGESFGRKMSVEDLSRNVGRLLFLFRQGQCRLPTGERGTGAPRIFCPDSLRGQSWRRPPASRCYGQAPNRESGKSTKVEYLYSLKEFLGGAECRFSVSARRRRSAPNQLLEETAPRTR